MSETEVDHLSISIDETLSSLSPILLKPYIFRVSDEVRRQNKKAYEPKMLAIGPYHHGKEKLQIMEGHKCRYLQQLLLRTKESSVNRYIVVLRELEEIARQCYGESIHLKKDKFVKMMLFDGFFIIELFRKFAFPQLIEKDDTIFHLDQNNNAIFHLDQVGDALRYDLVLFENQVPFFILAKLFDMTRDSNPPNQIIDLIDLALNFLQMKLPAQITLEPSEEIDHLLGLCMRWCMRWCLSYEMEPDRKTSERREDKVFLQSCLNFLKKKKNKRCEDEDWEWEYMKCTTELQDAGIKFKNPEGRTPLFDIKFEKGVLNIPLLQIDDNTETIFRNQIAYEQSRPSTYRRVITDYAYFIDSLINSAKDVEKLRHYGVIENLLGHDEAVSTMFNKLCSNVSISHPSLSSYPKVFKKVNKFCRHRRNTWLAKLYQNYLNCPWRIISICAAILLLGLTIVQTIFSVLSYITQK